MNDLAHFLHLWGITYPSIKITSSPLEAQEATFLDLSISIDVEREDENGMCPILIKSWDKPLNKQGK